MNGKETQKPENLRGEKGGRKLECQIGGYRASLLCFRGKKAILDEQRKKKNGGEEGSGVWGGNHKKGERRPAENKATTQEKNI